MASGTLNRETDVENNIRHVPGNRLAGGCLATGSPVCARQPARRCVPRNRLAGVCAKIGARTHRAPMPPPVPRCNEPVNAARRAMVSEASGKPGMKAAGAVAAPIANPGLPGTLRAFEVKPRQRDAIARQPMHGRWVLPTREKSMPRRGPGPVGRGLVEPARARHWGSYPGQDPDSGSLSRARGGILPRMTHKLPPNIAPRPGLGIGTQPA